MKLRLLTLLGATMVAILASVWASSGPASSGPDLASIGDPGVPVPVDEQVRASGVGNLLMIAKANGMAFYRAVRDSRECLGAGEAGTPGKLSFMVCGVDGTFPSQANPIIAIPDVSASREKPNDWTLRRIDGFAADGVTRVEVTDASGGLQASSPIVNNVFSIVPSHGYSLGEVRAFDTQNHAVYSHSFARGK